MAIVDIFIGSTQSKYAAIAVLVSIAAVGLTVLFSKEKVPFGQKLVIVLLMFLLSLPALLYALFQITCLVTGAGGPGVKGKTWWCGAWAWFISALIIIYSVIVVVMALLSLGADGEMSAVEQFYSQKDLYDTFAASEMDDSEEKKIKAASLGSGVGGAMDTTVLAPLPGDVNGEEVTGNPEAFRLQGPQTEMAAPVEQSAGELVSATIEKFTSCGAPLGGGPASY
jgi:hypothetical protein